MIDTVLPSHSLERRGLVDNLDSIVQNAVIEIRSCLDEVQIQFHIR